MNTLQLDIDGFIGNWGYSKSFVLLSKIMTKETAIKLFNEKQIRTLWDDTLEKWYFSIVDVVGVLAESSNPQTYWRVLKKRLLDEGNETVSNCIALKMLAADGKMTALSMGKQPSACRS